MTQAKAHLIANTFLREMNPTFWDGTGDKPDSFDERTWECSLTENVRLEIVFAYDECWSYYCDLVMGEDSFKQMRGSKINSPVELMKTVQDLCVDYE